VCPRFSLFLFGFLLATAARALPGSQAPAPHGRDEPDADSQWHEPEAGEGGARVLSPTLIELYQITEKEPAPAAVQGWSDFGTQPTATPLRGLRVTEGGRTLRIASAGWRRRVRYASGRGRDLRVGTYLVLFLADPVTLGDATQAVTVEDAEGLLLKAGTAVKADTDPYRTSPAIHVNQEGYVPSLPKKAMIGYYLGDLGEMPVAASLGYRVVEVDTGKEVFRGPLEPRPDIGYKLDSAPYQQVLMADFSAFTIPGRYRLVVPGLGASLPFLVNDGIAMGFTRTYALGLYEQRCGGPVAMPYTRFTHDACHTAPAQVPSSVAAFPFSWTTIAGYARTPNPSNPQQTAPFLTSPGNQLYPFQRAGPIDVSGGHHDAGDYSKYTINSAELIHYLIFAVDSIPGVAQMDNLGIPESGDGIPDVLQEAKWEADFLAKMQDADGGFYFLVYPQNREYESNVLPDHGDPQVVWPKNTAVTAASVAALAQASSSPLMKKYYPAAAAQYLKEAQLGWQFLTNAIAKYGKAGAYQKITFYGDDWTHDDELAWAACEMYLATGNTQYQTQLFSWFPNPADPSTFRWGWWRMSESWGNAIRSYAFAARSGRLPASALDRRYLALCEGQVLSAGDDEAIWSANNAYGTAFPTPTKTMRGGGWYFSMDAASDAAIAYQIEPRAEYLDAIVGAMNYEAGTNPVNVTYLTGLGIKRQREIVSQFAQNDRRRLPPSGIPIGNIQASFSYLPAYGSELRELSHPADDAAENSYPIYDRWSDAYNITTEYIAVNQARGLLAAAFLAARTSAASRPWKASAASIEVPEGQMRLKQPVQPVLRLPGTDLSEARIVWEARDQDPRLGNSFTVLPQNNGTQWVEAEAEWPDGRRVFASASFEADSPVVVWVEDSIPPGSAVGGTGGESWQWTDTDPAPHSGRRAHASPLAAGLHEHWFNGASSPLSVGPNDTLFTWVYLDPAHLPSELMISWNDGTGWEHRAYWGADSITYGRDGTPGRYRAGALPPAARWVRLAVSAENVGLAGRSVTGMGFSAVGGRLSWDESGRASSDKH